MFLVKICFDNGWAILSLRCSTSTKYIGQYIILLQYRDPEPSLNVAAAWRVATGKGIVVGVISDGVQRDHQDLTVVRVSFYCGARSTNRCSSKRL